MSFLSNTTIRKSLEENTPYPVTLISISEKEANTNTDGILGFVTFNWQLEDKRIISDTTRVTADDSKLPNGLKIRLSELADQLPNDSSLINLPGDEFIMAIMNSTTQSFNMWVERKETETNFYTNYHFRAPRQPKPSAPSTPSAPSVSLASIMN